MHVKVSLKNNCELARCARVWVGEESFFEERRFDQMTRIGFRSPRKNREKKVQFAPARHERAHHRRRSSPIAQRRRRKKKSENKWQFSTPFSFHFSLFSLLLRRCRLFSSNKQLTNRGKAEVKKKCNSNWHSNYHHHHRRQPKLAVCAVFFFGLVWFVVCIMHICIWW